jgi:hypothetical protein
MNQSSSQITASVMQSAIAPVFLISAVAVLVTCMAQRYGRVIDRTRSLLREGDRIFGHHRPKEHINLEIRSLYRRAKLLRTTIILASLSIFFVVLAIFFLFLGLMFQQGIPYAPEITFILSLVVLLISTGLFIEDFAISLQSIKYDIKNRGDDGVLESTPPVDATSSAT